MKQLLEIKGIISVLNTPFTKENTIDLISLKKNVKIAMKAGIKGFLVPAMAAEVNKLNAEERKSIVKTVVDATTKRVPIIGGASADTQEARIKYIHELEDVGCEAVLVSIPFENKDKYKGLIREIAQEVNTFLVIQDWDFHGFGIPVNVIVDLFEEQIQSSFLLTIIA